VLAKLMDGELDDLLNPSSFIYSDGDLLKLESRLDTTCAVARAAQSALLEFDNEVLAAAQTWAVGTACGIAKQIEALPATTDDGLHVKLKATKFVIESEPSSSDASHSLKATAPQLRDGVGAGTDFSSVSDGTPASSIDADAQVAVNFKVSEASAMAIARAASAEGTTQKVLITRALKAAGVHLAPRDLEDRTPRRRARE